MQLSAVITSLMATMAAAQTVHVVSVGSTEEDKALTFSPNKVTAVAGDMIQFQFRAGNHTVTQSTFDQPCMPVSMFTNNTGVYSGFQPVAASEAMGVIPTYTISVANTNPMWFYCSQGMHCQNGMVMVVNENTAGNSTRSLENFSSLAAAATVNLPGDATSVEEGTAGTTTTGEEGAAETGADAATGSAAGLAVPGTLIALGAALAYVL